MPKEDCRARNDRTINRSDFAGVLILMMMVLTGGGIHAEPANIIQPNTPPCTPVKTAAELQAMRNNLAGSYCLANDIDLRSIANFQPIGGFYTPFTGNFFGYHHVISNLRIRFNGDPSGTEAVGLFGHFGGTIQDVTLTNAYILARRSNGVGVLVGRGGGVISNVSVSGQISCVSLEISRSASRSENPDGVPIPARRPLPDLCGPIGGVIGSLYGPYAVANSSSSVNIVGGIGATSVGGLVGVLRVGGMNDRGAVRDSFATGDVSCSRNRCYAGGLVGYVGGQVLRSLATGRASTGADGSAGGLIGLSEYGAQISLSYATGSASGGDSSHVGGLVGTIYGGSRVDQSYSIGPVQGGDGASIGGLVGTNALTTGALTNSYWDVNTSGLATSAAGTARTTAQLRHALPVGFTDRRWFNTRRLSYPFLDGAGPDFTAPLATLVLSNNIFVFLPISQLDFSQYIITPKHEDAASLAAVYTMIARAIGITDDVAQLKDVKIDRYFWRDATQKTAFVGPLTEHARLGPLRNIPATRQITDSHFVDHLNLHRLVIVRGSYTDSHGDTATHWMLATLYKKNPDNTIAAIAANDPWTGRQVLIDPTSKKVVSPADFPLANFIVNGYQAVSVR